MAVELSVVVPTYNEADNLPVLAAALDSALRGRYEYELIVVDDDSPDKTWETGLVLASKGYPVLVVRRLCCRGYASAVVTGFAVARGEYVVVMDADLQHPPELVPALAEAAEETGADVVVASRYGVGGGTGGWGGVRLLASRTADAIAKLLFPEARATSDAASGFYLVRRRLLEEILDYLAPLSVKVLLEVLVAANRVRRGIRVVDVPYTFRLREAGRSKFGARWILEYLVHLYDLLIRKHTVMRPARPRGPRTLSPR